MNVYQVVCDGCSEPHDTDEAFTLPPGWARRGSGSVCEYCKAKPEAQKKIEDAKGAGKITKCEHRSTRTDHIGHDEYEDVCVDCGAIVGHGAGE